MFSSSSLTENVQSDLYQVDLTSNFESTTGSTKQVAFNSTSPQPEEGSFVWKHGSYYYLFFSSGLCCGFNASALPPAGNEYKVRPVLFHRICSSGSLMSP